jgi:electron transfer flavoprotein alpha subunit
MSKKVLVLAEHKGGELKKASLELVSAAAGRECSAILFGSQAQKAAQEILQYGVKKVFWYSDASWDHYTATHFAGALEQIIRENQFDLLLGSTSSMGKDLLPRIAARFEASLATDCIQVKIAESIELTRAFYSGKLLAQLELTPSALQVVSVRPNSLAPASKSQTGELVTLSVAAAGESAVRFLSQTEARSARPDLVEANIIVSGGRSLKSKENFKLIFDCADSLGAAAGASRAACDEGLADHDMQVGQTGKTVNPSLYIACGISGAIQHLAGMRTSKVIVAINKDPNAPIFSKATYGVVGDLFEVLPELTKQAKALLAKA